MLSAAATGAARAPDRFHPCLGTGLVSVCLVANAIGYSLAANLPQLFAAAVLLLTPLAFLLSTARNCRQLGGHLEHWRRYPDQWRVGRHHRLWCSLVAGA